MTIYEAITETRDAIRDTINDIKKLTSRCQHLQALYREATLKMWVDRLTIKSIELARLTAQLEALTALK